MGCLGEEARVNLTMASVGKRFVEVPTEVFGVHTSGTYVGVFTTKAANLPTDDDKMMSIWFLDDGVTYKLKTGDIKEYVRDFSSLSPPHQANLRLDAIKARKGMPKWFVAACK